MTLRSLLLVTVGALAGPLQAACPSLTNYTTSKPDLAGHPNDLVVTDNDTGLMWKRCPEGLSGASCTTGTQTYLKWAAALSAASGSTYAGYSDWRLPNINELASLADYACWNPAINTTFFPNSVPVTVFYWSSTTYMTDTAKVFELNFYDGDIDRVDKTNITSVRLVRGGQALDPFASESAGVVPAAFSLAAQTGVPLSTVIESNTITVSGLTTVTGIGVSGATDAAYAISTNGGATFGAFTSAPGAVANGNVVKVHHTSAATHSTGTTTTLTIGGISADFMTSTNVGLSQMLSFDPAPTVVVDGQGTVVATSAAPNSGKPIHYSADSSDCSVDADTGVVTGIHAGTDNCFINAMQPGDATYRDGYALLTLSIGKGTAMITTPPSASSITYGQMLAASTLSGGVASVPGTFAFITPSTKPNAGTQSEPIAFNPTDFMNYASTDASIDVVVTKGSTTTTLSTSCMTTFVGVVPPQAFTLTATVAGTALTGGATFTDSVAGTLCDGSVALAGDSAICTTSVLATGTHEIAATYDADANHDGSASAFVAVNVLDAADALFRYGFEALIDGCPIE